MTQHFFVLTNSNLCFVQVMENYVLAICLITSLVKKKKSFKKYLPYWQLVFVSQLAVTIVLYAELLLC